MLYTLWTIIIILAILLLIVATFVVQTPSGQSPVSHTSEATTVQECDFEDDEPCSKYIIAEKSKAGLFIRVVANGEATIEAAKEIIDTYAKSYQRIDICESDCIERGSECMSYSDGILVDYRTGEIRSIDL